MTAIHHMSASALAEAIASGSISCVETMQAFLTQIEATNPAVNALINLDPPEHCLALAAKADEALRAGQRKGWLHGMPIAIKDLAGAAATAAGSETVIKGVSGHSMEAVLGMPTQPPLGYIGLANDDGTRCPNTRNVGVIFCRDE